MAAKEVSTCGSSVHDTLLYLYSEISSYKYLYFPKFALCLHSDLEFLSHSSFYLMCQDSLFRSLSPNEFFKRIFLWVVADTAMAFSVSFSFSFLYSSWMILLLIMIMLLASFTQKWKNQVLISSRNTSFNVNSSSLKHNSETSCIFFTAAIHMKWKPPRSLKGG